ncbi:hypothetical protein SpCBS45565_g00168 [Spizellomyces sp. 'palustris']|nr:hypothetical protein SpCBS45565_g00168 [Spizellomyces sp. 'palustris']
MSSTPFPSHFARSLSLAKARRTGQLDDIPEKPSKAEGKGRTKAVGLIRNIKKFCQKLRQKSSSGGKAKRWSLFKGPGSFRPESVVIHETNTSDPYSPSYLKSRDMGEVGRSSETAFMDNPNPISAREPVVEFALRFRRTKVSYSQRRPSVKAVKHLSYIQSQRYEKRVPGSHDILKSPDSPDTSPILSRSDSWPRFSIDSETSLHAHRDSLSVVDSLVTSTPSSSASARLDAQVQALDGAFSRIRAAQNLKKEDLDGQNRRSLGEHIGADNYEGRGSLEVETGGPSLELVTDCHQPYHGHTLAVSGTRPIQSVTFLPRAILPTLQGSAERGDGKECYSSNTLDSLYLDFRDLSLDQLAHKYSPDGLSAHPRFRASVA